MTTRTAIGMKMIALPRLARHFTTNRALPVPGMSRVERGEDA